jgi:hypothetical protein
MKAGRFSSLVVALLVAAMLVPGVRLAAAEQNRDGEDQPHETPAKRQVGGRILVPTFVAVRPFTPRTLDGISHYYIDSVRPGSYFSVVADSAPLVPVPCVAICTPDFDIVFYGAPSGDGFEHVAGRYNAAGNEAGTVPMTAEFAFVFLRGPNAPPDAFGSRFVYEER